MYLGLLPHFLRWHHLEILPYVFTDYRIICSPAIIVLVPILGPTAIEDGFHHNSCLLYTSPSPRDKRQSRMPSSA